MLPCKPDTWIDVGVEDVDNQIDQHEHDPGFHDDALHKREVALENALVEQPSDARPGEDDLYYHCGVDHHDEIDAGQSQHRDQRVLECVYRDDREAWQALQMRQLDVFAAQHFEHAR